MIEVQPKKRKPQRRTAETRARLVEAALHEFGEHGFQGASTRAIAKRAGAAQSAVEYHFASKEELWKASADHIFGIFREHRQSQVEALKGIDLPTRVRIMVRNFVRFCAEHPEMHRLMGQERASHGHRLEWMVAKHVQPMHDALLGTLAALKKAGYAVPEAPDHYYHMVIGLVSTPYTFAPSFELLTGKDPFSEEMIDAHAEAVLRMLFPDLQRPRTTSSKR